LRGATTPAGGPLLVGPQTFDDAGVVVLGEAEGLSAGHRLGLVQTADFFPPVVDDPTLYGAIAAANSLSDVYAMGGRPISALSLACFPSGFRTDWRSEILRGGYEKIVEAGAVLAGGHTMTSEILYGYAVTGIVDLDRVTTNAGAKPGDVIYLTKPVGTGAVTTAAKLSKISWEVLRPVALQMAVLNDRAAEAMGQVTTHACTDVTGFGLVGHAHNIAMASGVCLRLRAADIPLVPDALELARRGLTSGAAKRGRVTLGDTVRIADDLEEARIAIFFDAETSGGLLIVIPPDEVTRFEEAARERKVSAHRVGEVVAREDFAIEVL
jgi:selenide, water dikinase